MASFSPEARTNLQNRVAALLTLMAAPTEAIGDIQRTYEYADALERQGDITAAAALRTETDLALASALSGAGGVARGAAVCLETLASTTGKLVVKAETLVAKGAPGAAEAGTAGKTGTGATKGGSNNTDVWALPATERGKVIEQRLAQTDYKGWYNVGQEKNGYFPLVDFHKGDTLVSLKSVDTTGTTWMGRMTEHIEALGKSGATVNGRAANMMLDLRVQPGGTEIAKPLLKIGKREGVVVRITEVTR